MAIRVLIADDDPLVCEGLQVILGHDAGLSVEAVVTNGSEAVERCRARPIDVALLDAKMPVLDGPDACARITSELLTRCCILSTFREQSLVERAIRAGASGYLLKGVGGEEIKQAIRLIHGGNTVFQESVFASISRGGSEPDLSMLTERERQIVRAIARGLSNREIADELFLSEGTVKNYLSAALSKLGLSHRTQVAIYYLEGT